MTTNDSGKDIDAGSGTATSGILEEAARNHGIFDGIQQSLFFDSIDPRFRPRLSGPEISPQSSMTISSPVDSVFFHNDSPTGSGGAEPQALFKGQKASDDLTSPANRQLYASPLPFTPGYHTADLYNENRQRFADRAADMIFPGLGRITSKSANQEWRLDYPFARKCHVKGAGLCLSIKWK
jgi:hypothetical protein